MEIKNSKDFVVFMVETMEGLKNGDITPAARNAIANLSDKLVKMIALEMKVMAYPKLGDRKPLKIESK